MKGVWHDEGVCVSDEGVCVSDEGVCVSVNEGVCVW
jgi:hypothetical protein